MVDVDINYDKKTAEIACPTKSQAKFKVNTAPGGYIFYEVSISKGKVPEALAGRWSGLDVAVKAVTKYFEQMVPTKMTKVKANQKRAEEHRNATADNAEGSK
jgi:hypothetical protein